MIYVKMYTANSYENLGVCSAHWCINRCLRQKPDSSRFLNSLLRRSNVRNVSFRIFIRWPIHIINPVDKTKLSAWKTIWNPDNWLVTKSERCIFGAQSMNLFWLRHWLFHGLMSCIGYWLSNLCGPFNVGVIQEKVGSLKFGLTQG